jgi:hypothetical protein
MEESFFYKYDRRLYLKEFFFARRMTERSRGMGNEKNRRMEDVRMEGNKNGRMEAGRMEGLMNGRMKGWTKMEE